jgi:hypothetical protein
MGFRAMRAAEHGLNRSFSIFIQGSRSAIAHMNGKPLTVNRNF